MQRTPDPETTNRNSPSDVVIRRINKLQQVLFCIHLSPKRLARGPYLSPLLYYGPLILLFIIRTSRRWI